MDTFKTTIFALTAVCASAMTSCKLSREFIKPNPEMPAAFDSSLDTDTFSMADVDWRIIYTDPKLQQLIEQALESNKDLAIAEARIRELASLRRSSKAELFPSAGGNLYIQREDLNYGGHNHKDDKEDGLKGTVTWEPDIWGNLRWADEKSKALWLASVEGRNAVKAELIASMAQAYYELVALDNELSIVNQTVDARREGERIAKLRWQGGLTSETSYQQAKVELERTITRVPILQRTISIKESEITLLLGEYPKQVIRSERLDNVDLPSSLPVGLPSSLLRRRPDLRQAELSLRAANASVGVAYTDRFPRLTLTAIGGLESEELKDFFKSPMSFLSGALLGPIFDFGRRQGRYRAAQAALEQEQLRYEKTVIEAFTEVRNAIVDFNKVKEIYASAVQLERSAHTTMDLAQLQYINGVIGYLDVLDAQRNYFEAQIGLSNALRSKQLTIVQLYRVLGGGWQP